jgi:hypothetical protein
MPSQCVRYTSSNQSVPGVGDDSTGMTTSSITQENRSTADRFHAKFVVAEWSRREVVSART